MISEFLVNFKYKQQSYMLYKDINAIITKHITYTKYK